MKLFQLIAMALLLSILTGCGGTGIEVENNETNASIEDSENIDKNITIKPSMIWYNGTWSYNRYKPKNVLYPYTTYTFIEVKQLYNVAELPAGARMRVKVDFGNPDEWFELFREMEGKFIHKFVVTLSFNGIGHVIYADKTSEYLTQLAEVAPAVSALSTTQIYFSVDVIDENNKTIDYLHWSFE